MRRPERGDTKVIKAVIDELQALLERKCLLCISPAMERVT